MNFLKLGLLLITTVCLGSVSSYAQSDIVASGADGTGSGGSISFSVGQVAYTTNTGSGISEAQGVQQPFEITVITSIENDEKVALEISTYPNPTTDNLTLKVETEEVGNLNYQLFDLSGKLLESKKITNHQTTISMNGLAASTYLLNVISNGENIKTFNIIKNQ